MLLYWRMLRRFGFPYRGFVWWAEVPGMIGIEPCKGKTRMAEVQAS